MLKRENRSRSEYCGIITFFIVILVLFNSFSLLGLSGETEKIRGIKTIGQLQSVQRMDVPLNITDYFGVNRFNEPVTTGVPISKEQNITSIGQLEITDNYGNSVPAQFTVLSRWGSTHYDSSKPIRWVLVDFQANVMANSTTTYHLKRVVSGGGNTNETNMTVNEDVNYINVTTGPAKFVISKNHFTLFDYVYVDTDGDGIPDKIITDNHLSGGLSLVDENNITYYTIFDKPEVIAVESSGPLRTVVHIRGNFRAVNGSYYAPSLHHPPVHPDFDQPYNKSYVYYDCRIYFYNNKDYVKIFLRFENNGMLGIGTEPFAQTIYYKSINLTINKNIGGQQMLRAYNMSTTLTSNDTYSLYQSWREGVDTFRGGIYYEYYKNGNLTSNGSTNPGYMDVYNSSVDMAVAVRHFWQNYPKEIVVNKSSIMLGLWPYDGYFPDYNNNSKLYKLRGGKYKTHEIGFRFSGHVLSDGDILQLKAFEEKPLIALAPASYYVETRGWGIIGPYNITLPDPELNEAVKRYERLQSALVYENDSDNGWTILNLRTKYPPHWELKNQRSEWGWINVGDLVWAGGYGGIHYDWPYVMLLHYLRTGKRRFFDLGYEMATHRYDIDQYHGDRSWGGHEQWWYNHIQTYEKGDHCDHIEVPKLSHTWNGGLVLYYLLTGDRYALETAKENGIAIITKYDNPLWTSHYAAQPGAYTSNGGEIRFESWSTLNLINLYRATGEKRYLQVAINISKNILLYYEIYGGKRGYWGTHGEFYTDEVHFRLPTNRQLLTMSDYVIEPMLTLYYETQDREIGNLIVRMANFAKNHYIYGGYYTPDGKYMPLQPPYWWHKKNPNHGDNIVCDIFYTDLFAYAYMLTNDTAYLNWARKTFRDEVFYYAAPTGTPLNPSYRSTISYIDNMFPGSHTKAHSWIGRNAQIYLYVENLLQKRGKRINGAWRYVRGKTVNVMGESLGSIANSGLKYIDHSPIIINGDTNNSWNEFPGAGTVNDPKIITGYSINGQASTGCIELSNTRLYVIIKDNFLQNANYAHGGIVLQNVSNVIIENNTITSNYLGIKIHLSNNITINNNTIRNEYWDDLYIKNSHDIEIRWNIIYNNSGLQGYGRGIYLYSVTNSHMVDNNIYNHHSNYAIELVESKFNYIISNKLKDNYGGIFLMDSPDNTMINNTMWNNSLSIQGDKPEYYRQNITINNTVNGISIHYHRDSTNLVLDRVTAWEIILYNCTGTAIRNIDLTNSSVGIMVVYSRSTVIANSTFRNNRDFGIKIWMSNNTQINNISILKDEYGYDTIYGYSIYAEKSNYTMIENSTLYNNYRGIYMIDANHGVIRNNHIFKNEDTGIYILSCENLSIINNTVSGQRWNGLSLDHLKNSNIAGNKIDDNGERGLGLYTSSYNTIQENIIFNNSGDALAFFKCENNRIIGNAMEMNTGYDMYIWESENNTFYSNKMYGRGICIEGYFAQSFVNIMGENNTIYDKTVVYLVNVENFTIHDMNAGQIIIVSSYNVSILNVTVSQVVFGLLLVNSRDITVKNSTFANNEVGVYLWKSSNTSIYGNRILFNMYGMYSSKSSWVKVQNNTFRRNHLWAIDMDYLSSGYIIWMNNFIKNRDYPMPFMYFQAWETRMNENHWNTTTGNYWSDYTYHYPNAGNDGYVWDTPYSIIGGGMYDYHPLVSPVGNIVTPFVILKTEPEDGDTNVSVNTNIVIYFSKEVMVGSVPNNITITPHVNISNYQWDSGHRNLTLVMSEPFQYNTIYKVVVSDNITSSSDEHLLYSYTFTFKTKNLPPTIYRIWGYVFDGHGNPIGGAEVAAYLNSVNVNTTYTQSDGYYELTLKGYPGDNLMLYASYGTMSGTNGTTLENNTDLRIDLLLEYVPELNIIMISTIIGIFIMIYILPRKKYLFP